MNKIDKISIIYTHYKDKAGLADVHLYIRRGRKIRTYSDKNHSIGRILSVVNRVNSLEWDAHIYHGQLFTKIVYTRPKTVSIRTKLEFLELAFNHCQNTVDMYDNPALDRVWHILGSVAINTERWTNEQHNEQMLLDYGDAWKINNE